MFCHTSLSNPDSRRASDQEPKARPANTRAASGWDFLDAGRARTLGAAFLLRQAIVLPVVMNTVASAAASEGGAIRWKVIANGPE